MGRRRGRPPAGREVVAYLIGANRTKVGPKIQSELDEYPCQTVRNATHEEMESLAILHDRFRSEYDGTPAHRSRNEEAFEARVPGSSMAGFQRVRNRTETGSIALTIRRITSR